MAKKAFITINSDKFMHISIGTAAEYLGVSTSTLRRWDQQNILKPTYRTVGKHRRYQFKRIIQFIHQIANKTLKFNPNASIIVPKAIIYARVSASKQRHDLVRQIEHLQDFVTNQGWNVQKIYKDIGSGVNDQRKGLHRMLKDLITLQPDFLVCTYPDRLTRFGTGFITAICNFYSVKIIYTKQHNHTMTKEEKLTQDFIAILTSYAGRIHRQRRGRYTKTSPN